MDTSNDSSPKRSGTLVFDLKCQLLYSNYDGRVLYIGEGNGATGQAPPDIAFDIKRLCFRLKKLVDSVATEGGTFDKRRVPSIAVTSSDLRYRLEGSLLADEVTKQACLLVKVEKEESKGPGKLNFSHYQSLYGLTRREIQILELLSKGASYKEISYSLMISFHTVRDHIKHIRFKLHADGKCGILARLIEEGSVYEETVVTETGDLLNEAVPLAGLASGEPSASTGDPRCTIGGKTRLSVSTPAASSKPRGNALTHTSVGTPSGTAAVRTTASWRPATKRDLHPKGKAL